MQTDLCLGGGGTSLYERAILGIPSVVITVAENQIPNTISLAKLNTITYLDHYDQWTSTNLLSILSDYLMKPSSLLANQSQNCYDLMKECSYDQLLEGIFLD